MLLHRPSYELKRRRHQGQPYGRTYGYPRPVFDELYFNLKLKLMGVNTRTTKENIVIIDINVEIENKDMLNKFVNSMKNIESVYEVNRKRG